MLKWYRSSYGTDFDKSITAFIGKRCTTSQNLESHSEAGHEASATFDDLGGYRDALPRAWSQAVGTQKDC